MYCKLSPTCISFIGTLVLIVAKCIVNTCNKLCLIRQQSVLIVAKCIVNLCIQLRNSRLMVVLIVAKCIVNKIKSKKEKLKEKY